MFAKLYETKYGQILVKLDNDNDDSVPEIRFYFKPPELGICTIAVLYKDTAEDWDKANKILEQITEEDATRHVGKALDAIEETDITGDMEE